MNKTVVLVVVLAACGGSRTERFAVGATSYLAAPSRCSIVDTGGGSIVELADHHEAEDGKGIVFRAIKAGTAKIDCEGNYGATIDVREASKIELLRVDGAKTPVAVGTGAPTICVQAFDKDGAELQVGTLVEGVDIRFSEHVRHVVDHGMGGGGSPACGREQSADKEGVATVTATWRGMTAKSEFRITRAI